MRSSLEKDTTDYLHAPVQLASGLSSVQSVLGPTSGVSDKEIKDALWYYYFDEEKAISYLLDQQHKKNAAREKAEAGKRVLLIPSHARSRTSPTPFHVHRSDFETSSIKPRTNRRRSPSRRNAIPSSNQRRCSKRTWSKSGTGQTKFVRLSCCAPKAAVKYSFKALLVGCDKREGARLRCQGLRTQQARSKVTGSFLSLIETAIEQPSWRKASFCD